MEESKRKASFLLSMTAMILIFIIICLNTNQSLFYTPGPFKNWTDYLPFLSLNLCAFLCSLLLQAEEILTIYRKRKSLVIRRELIIMGALCFLLGLEKYFCLLLIPASQLANLGFGFAIITEAVFLAGNIDIVFMFAAGVLFVRAFQLPDVPIDRKQRRKYLLLYVGLIFLIVLVDYLRVLAFVNIKQLSWNIYLFSFLYIVPVFVYSLILQAERLVSLFHKRKELQVNWEMIALSIAAIFIEIIENWMALHLFAPIIRNITGGVLWQIAFSFAAGMFFVGAFSARSCQDNELKLNDDSTEA